MVNPQKQFITAYGFIRNKDNHFLLVRRAQHDSHPGMWELPGGSVESGETLTGATKREVAEEAGLEVTVGPTLATIYGTSSKGNPVERHAFLCTIDDPTKEVVLSEEHDAYQWISLEDALPTPVSRLVEEIYQQKETLPL